MAEIPMQDERAKFEAWAKAHSLFPQFFDSAHEYSNPETESAWRAWQARASEVEAARASQPVQPPYANSFGYSLAMAVLQSDLYRALDTQMRAECDELIRRGQSDQGAPHG